MLSWVVPTLQPIWPVNDYMQNPLNRNIKKSTASTAPSGRGGTSSLPSNFSNFKFFTSSGDLNTSKKRGKLPSLLCRLVRVSGVSRVGQIMILMIRAGIRSYLKQPSTNQDFFEPRSPRLQDLLREVPEAVVIFEWRMGKRTACTAKVQACCQNPAAGQDINDARIPKESLWKPVAACSPVDMQAETRLGSAEAMGFLPAAKLWGPLGPSSCFPTSKRRKHSNLAATWPSRMLPPAKSRFSGLGAS